MAGTNNHTVTTVAAIPNCNICHEADAAVDGRTVFGLRAYMCHGCFQQYSVGFGLGKGQKLVCDIA